MTFQFLCWKSNQWLRTHPAQMIGRHCLQCSACVCNQKGGSFSTIGRSISLFVPEANPNRFKMLITGWCFGNLGTRVWNVWQLIKIDVFDSDFREVDAFRKKSSNCMSLHLSRYLSAAHCPCRAICTSFKCALCSWNMHFQKIKSIQKKLVTSNQAPPSITASSPLLMPCPRKNEGYNPVLR